MSVFSFYFYKNLNKLDYSSYLENSVVFFFKSALKDKKKKKSAAPVIRDSSWRWHVYTVLLWHLWLHQRGKWPKAWVKYPTGKTWGKSKAIRVTQEPWVESGASPGVTGANPHCLRPLSGIPCTPSASLLWQMTPDLKAHAIPRFRRSEASAASSRFSARGLARLKRRFHRLGSHMEALGENPPPDSFWLPAKLGPMWLHDWGPHFLAGIWAGLILSFYRIPHS